MAYYKRQEVVEFINSACEKIKASNHTPITDPQKALSELTEEQDLVGFFWLELSPNGDNGVGINMEGKVFVKLDSETYTDDRFALDSYHAAKDGVSVTDIIKKREEEKKNASQQINPDVIENLKNFLTNNNNTI
jgi:hypothetical protein